MNESEQIEKRNYECKGYTVVCSGAPDFLCFKRDSDGKMYDILFVEVKSLRGKSHEKLKEDQKLWGEALQAIEWWVTWSKTMREFKFGYTVTSTRIF